MLYEALRDAVETGFPYTVAFLGVWMTFRLQRDFDLTVDGSFTLGAAVFAAHVAGGGSAVVGMGMAVVAGGLAGLTTFILMQVLDLSLVLASIIVSVGLFSVSLAVMGQANINLFGMANLVTDWSERFTGGDQGLASLELFGLIALLIFAATWWVLRSEFGLALRASGQNAPMVRTNGGNPKFLLCVSVVVGNAFVGLSGSLLAQQQGFVDISMGVGTIIFGVTAILVGEVVLFARSSLVRALAAVLIGTLLYRMILSMSFRLGVPPNYLQGLTAVIVVAILGTHLAVARMRAKTRDRRTPPPVEPGNPVDPAEPTEPAESGESAEPAASEGTR